MRSGSGILPKPVQIIDGTAYGPLRVAAETLGATVAWDGATQSVQITSKKSSGASQTHSTRLTLELKRPGTLLNPLDMADTITPTSAGSYKWTLDWRFGKGEKSPIAIVFTPDGDRIPQTILLARTESGFSVTPSTTDMSARLETSTYFADMDFEASVRVALGKPTGALTDADVRQLTSLPLTTYQVHDLCRMPSLTHLTVDQGKWSLVDLLDMVTEASPRITHLTMTKDGATPLPAGPGTETTTALPYRVESTRGVFLGDSAMGLATLAAYAKQFEEAAIPNLEQDTGLTPTGNKPVFELYGDEATWNQETGSSAAYGYYSPMTHRIRMAHWRGRYPGEVNELLLTHEYLHWLAHEAGKAVLPFWFNEGLAHNEAWRWYWKSAGWDNRFTADDWARVASSNVIMPNLPTYRTQDEWVVTAVAYLLEKHGGAKALQKLFQVTQSGKSFEEAFVAAFGLTPAAYQTEYANRVEEVRAKG